MKRLRISVSGRVQGVFFRASARREARQLGLTGFARNEPDGSVTIEVQGEESAVQEFFEWAKEGPRSARVGKVETKEYKLMEGEKGFMVENNHFRGILE